MTREYYPLCVRDPRSMYHLVRIRPNQDLAILLSKEKFSSPELEIASSYLSVNHASEDANNRVFRLAQTDSIRTWSQYSSTYLGEVWITHEHGISRLLVIQDCTNPQKTNLITVVNPKGFDLRVFPHNIMEFILYEPSFGCTADWEWIWKPKFDCVKICCLGEDTKGLHPNRMYQSFESPSDQYAKLARFDVSPTEHYRQQQHFWFRFEKDLVQLLTSEIGTINVGSFHFTGCPGPYCDSDDIVTFCASIFLNTKKPRVASFESIIETLPPLRSYVSSRPKFQIYVKKQALPIINEVCITRVETSELAEGCKTLSAVPSDEKSPVVNDYDDYDLATYCKFPARFHKSYQWD